jgi:hypothetical protein
MATFIEKPRTPKEILDFLKREWNKISTEKVEERKFEGFEQKDNQEEKNCRENLKRITEEFDRKILEYEGIVKQNPKDIRKRLENIRARMMELLGQYRFFFGRMKTIVTAEYKVESLEIRDFQEIANELDRIRHEISEHSLS